MTDTTNPTAPSNLHTTSVTGTSVALAWTASTDPDDPSTSLRYHILRDGVLVGTAPAGTTTFTDNTVVAGTTYLYTVRALDPAGNVGSSSLQLSVTTPTGTDTSAPTTPTNLHTTAVAANSVALAWTASTDPNDPSSAINYHVLRNGVLIATTSAGVTSYTDTTVLASTTYSYTLRAKDPAGNLSGTSIALSVTTPAGTDTTPPSVPAGLTTTLTVSSEVDLSWTASTDAGSGVARYRIYRDGAFLAAVTAPATAYKDLAVSANTTYSYTVSAVDGAGNESAQSAADSVTTPPTTIGVNALFGASGPVFSQGEITNEETAIGRHIYFANEFYDWTAPVPSFASSPDNWLVTRSPVTYPVLNILGVITPTLSTFPGASIAAGGGFNDQAMIDMANGVYDSTLVAWRNYLATIPSLHFIRPWRDMTKGPAKCAWQTSTGQIYINAWRRMYTIIKGDQASYTDYNTNQNPTHPIIATPNPALNCLVIWSPAVWAGDYRPWFPGAAWVDVAGIAGEAWATVGGAGNANGPAGTGGWHTFDEIFSTFYGQFNKTNGSIAPLPVIITEMNAQESTDQVTFNRSAWWTAAAASLANYPDLYGVSVWISGSAMPGSGAIDGAAAYISFANSADLSATSFGDTGSSGGGTPVAPSNSVIPTISDTTPVLGEVLTAQPGTWAGDAPITFSGVWQRSSDGGTTWTTITVGLASTQFLNDTVTVQSGWTGQILRITVTGTNAAGHVAATSLATSAVGGTGSAPLNTAAPTINDTTPQTGQQIQGTTGTWTGTTPLNYTGLWEVADTSAGPWSPAPGVVGTTVFQADTYTVAATDFSRVLRFSVTAANSIGSTGPVASLATNPIGAAPINDTPPTITAPDTPPQVGDVIVSTSGTWH